MSSGSTRTTTTTASAAFPDLKALVQGEVLTDEQSRRAVSSDFGRMVERVPRVVVRPRTAKDVAAVMKYAREKGLKVSSRGEAHTQTGQGLTDGILVDLGSMHRVLSVDEKGLTSSVEAGCKWRDLVLFLDPKGLVPPVLTNNLGVTIGGTLSVAGLGISSFKYGAQVDNALELEVVTGAGDVVTCSPSKKRDLFDCVRSGLGQFGVITRATLKLRRRLPMVRTYFLLYDDLDPFMKDSEVMLVDERFDYMESWCSPCPQGIRKVEGENLAFAQWFMPYHLTKEFEPGKEPDEKRLLAGLRHYKKVHVEDKTTLDFSNRLNPLFEIWKRIGYWDRPHPWMENIIPWAASKEYIHTVLENMQPQALGGGHVLLWPAKGNTSEAPLFKVPKNEKFVMGFGILPGVPREFLDLAVSKLNQASELGMMIGAKRYLSGLIHFDESHWEAHFEEDWPRMKALKKKYDPHLLLNSHFMPL